MPNGLFKSLRFLWFVCFFVLTIAFFLLFSFIIHKTYENDSLEQISTVINRIYRELLLNEKRMAKELKTLNEATKNNREKLRR